MPRLNADTIAYATNVVACPYRPEAHGIGIVHLGLGAFHRAHQAWYTHGALASSAGDWRIASVSFRSVEISEALTEQDGFFTLAECDRLGAQLSIIGSIAEAYSLLTARQGVLDILVAQSTKIITITATEKAYCLAASLAEIDEGHDAIQHDIKDMETAISLPGFITLALEKRRTAGQSGLTILSCDNIPQNGQATRVSVLGVARLYDAGLADWIERHCAFPSSMVDRITPAVQAEALTDIESQTGLSDKAALLTERFSQWVIEDDFPFGRPDWAAAGAILVRDVTPFEEMKLRMLNGTHSLLAYAGHLAGKETIRDCMDDPAFKDLAKRHMDRAAASLSPSSDIDISTYAASLMNRFNNPNIRHETYQIAMDGSQKMPPRIFEPAMQLCSEGKPIDTMAFAMAVWLKYTQGLTDAGEKYPLRDPRETQLSQAVSCCSTGTELYEAALTLEGLIPADLAGNIRWRRHVVTALDLLFEQGASQAIKHFIHNT